MPSDPSEIYGDIVLFGIRVSFCANDQRALDVALMLYAEWWNDDAPRDSPAIYIVLNAYDVNPVLRDAHDVENHRMTIARDGVTIEADGKAGKGSCVFPRGVDDERLADMINTMVLFLVGHAGRVPLHASAVMQDGTAIIFAGASGAGKSTLALAASRAGLPLLSDDTIYVQTEPVFRLWSLAGPIHVFAKDAPGEQESGMRFRAGRWKKVLVAPERHWMADRAILCVLERGAAVNLAPMAAEDAVRCLTANPEPGYQFYGEASRNAAQTLATKGVWRLTLSDDPAQAIALIRQHLSRRAGISFHRRYVALVREIEQRFAVTEWKNGDANLWPLARFDLYLDMYWDNVGERPPKSRAWPLRLAGRVLKLLVNLWRSRGDLAHWRGWPKQAPVIFLGDGVSLDRIQGVYQDRQGEALMTALEKRGLETSLMQSGELVRLPWRRPTFAANLVEAWGALLSPLFARRSVLPDHRAVTMFLAEQSVRAPSLARAALARRARHLHAMAFLFGRLLKHIKPRLAFVVSYYAGLGPAFILACRRHGVLAADLQHAPLEGAPMAYRFDAYPAGGYSTLPSLFWSWAAEDAEAVRQGPHRSLYGGPPQLSGLGRDNWDQLFAGDFTREILVALQPIGGHRGDWEKLATVIEAAPPHWRWWLRRHPASRPDQDAAFGRLLSLPLANIRITDASAVPLPVLLRRMSVVLSLASGAAMEAAMFGVPAFFLSDAAEGPFGSLIAGGRAAVIAMEELCPRIAGLAGRPGRDPRDLPKLDAVLAQLEKMADEYAAAHRMPRDPVNVAAARCAEKSKPV
jgi:hypothetical protein